MKTGFWKALIGSCSGTAIFPALRTQHVGRAVWHLILMVLLCAIVMSVGFKKSIQPAVKRATDIFLEHCGGIRMDEFGVTPLDAPEKARAFLLPGAWAVSYFPLSNAADAQLLNSLDIELGAKQGVIWNAKHLVLWRKHAEIFDANAISRRGGLEKTVQFTTSGEVLKFAAESAPSGLETAPEAAMTLGKESFEKVINLALPLGIGAVVLQRTFSEVIIYILMFAGVFTLMNLGRPGSRVRFKELFVLEIYAGFPAMIIGSAATALSLPFLEFNLVYVMGMTLYLIWILNHLNALQEAQSRRDHDHQAEGR